MIPNRKTSIMAASQTTQAETEMRIARCARIIANGGRRSDCLQYAATNWGSVRELLIII